MGTMPETPSAAGSRDEVLGVAAAAAEGRALTLEELRALTEACKGRYRDVVPVPALAGLRWGELAGLQVGDRVSVPGPGLRLRRTVLASGGGGALYVDTLKNHRARTVPLALDLVPIVDRWSAGKAPDAWLFDAPEGGPCGSRTGNARSAGARLGPLQACPAFGFMICVIRQHRSGWPLARTRRWYSVCWGTPWRR
jgi:integrase